MTVTSSSLRFALLITASGGFLDAYTLLARGGVFATAQTGNVVFLALNLSHANWSQALAHLWPIAAFVLGVSIATHVKQGRLDRLLPHALRWTIALQVVVLAVVGFLPGTVPPSLITIPIAFVAALQIELFRSVGDLTYIAVATTGNLMRWVEAGYGRITTGGQASRLAFRTYSFLIVTFASGALVGAITNRALGVHASWVPAALSAATLLLFVLNDRADAAD